MSQEPDTATILSELQTEPSDEYIAEVLALYRRIMDVHTDAESEYLRAIHQAARYEGSATTTNL